MCVLESAYILALGDTVSALSYTAIGAVCGITWIFFSFLREALISWSIDILALAVLLGSGLGSAALAR